MTTTTPRTAPGGPSGTSAADEPARRNGASGPSPSASASSTTTSPPSARRTAGVVRGARRRGRGGPAPGSSPPRRAAPTGRSWARPASCTAAAAAPAPRAAAAGERLVAVAALERRAGQQVERVAGAGSPRRPARRGVLRLVLEHPGAQAALARGDHAGRRRAEPHHALAGVARHRAALVEHAIAPTSSEPSRSGATIAAPASAARARVGEAGVGRRARRAPAARWHGLGGGLVEQRARPAARRRRRRRAGPRDAGGRRRRGPRSRRARRRRRERGGQQVVGRERPDRRRGVVQRGDVGQAVRAPGRPRGRAAAARPPASRAPRARRWPSR